VYLVNSYNRFEACRFGIGGDLVEPYSGARRKIGQDILESIAKVAPHAAQLGCGDALAELAAMVRVGPSDAAWLRSRYAARGSLADVVRDACARWEKDA
jgi:carboxylate-amine ligase